MSSSIHVLIECEIKSICKVDHLLIYLENCMSEIGNFDIVINFEIYVWIQFGGLKIYSQ